MSEEQASERLGIPLDELADPVGELIEASKPILDRWDGERPLWEHPIGGETMDGLYAELKDVLEEINAHIEQANATEDNDLKAPLVRTILMQKMGVEMPDAGPDLLSDLHHMTVRVRDLWKAMQTVAAYPLRAVKARLHDLVGANGCAWCPDPCGKADMPPNVKMVAVELGPDGNARIVDGDDMPPAIRQAIERLMKSGKRVQ